MAKRGRKPVDIKGLRFGRLTVLDLYQGEDRGPHAQWVCRCDCGNKIVTRGDRLRYGQQTSCGCLRADPAWRKTVWKNHYDAIVQKRRKKSSG